MNLSHPGRLPILAFLVALLLAGCATGLQPVDMPDEFTPPPSDAARWESLDAVRELHTLIAA